MSSYLKYALTVFMIAGVLFVRSQATATDIPAHNLSLAPTIRAASHTGDGNPFTASTFLNTPQNQNIGKPGYFTMIDESVCTCPFHHVFRMLANNLPENDADIPNDNPALSILITTGDDAVFLRTRSAFRVSQIISDKRNFKIVLKQ